MTEKKCLFSGKRLFGFTLFLAVAAVSLSAQDAGLFTPDFLPLEIEEIENLMTKIGQASS
ncbi:MAG: hypothetical protein WAU81_05570 [Candidatus Aminicenantales bacterium]